MFTSITKRQSDILSHLTANSESIALDMFRLFSTHAPNGRLEADSSTKGNPTNGGRYLNGSEGSQHFVQTSAEQGPHVPFFDQTSPANLVELQWCLQVHAHVHFGLGRL